MPSGPTPAYRIELAYTALACGLVASGLFMVVLIVAWRQGRNGPLLLSLTGSGAITLGLSVSSAVRLVGLKQGTDTSILAPGIQFGAAAVALAFLMPALITRWRRTTVR